VIGPGAAPHHHQDALGHAPLTPRPLSHLRRSEPAVNDQLVSVGQPLDDRSRDAGDQRFVAARHREMHASAPPAQGGFHLDGEHRLTAERVVGGRVNLRAHHVGPIASPIADFAPEQQGQEGREAQKQSGQITHDRPPHTAHRRSDARAKQKRRDFESDGALSEPAWRPAQLGCRHRARSSCEEAITG